MKHKNIQFADFSPVFTYYLLVETQATTMNTINDFIFTLVKCDDWNIQKLVFSVQDPNLNWRKYFFSWNMSQKAGCMEYFSRKHRHCALMNGRVGMESLYLYKFFSLNNRVHDGTASDKKYISYWIINFITRKMVAFVRFTFLLRR